MLSVQTKAAGNVVLNSSILDYYHVDLQISIDLEEEFRGHMWCDI